MKYRLIYCRDSDINYHAQIYNNDWLEEILRLQLVEKRMQYSRFYVICLNPDMPAWISQREWGGQNGNVTFRI